jgi:hypothetical protein
MELGYADDDQIRAMYYRFMDQDNDADEPKAKAPSTSSSVSTESTLTDLADVERFVRAIPSGYVTPAELQNFFICHLDAIEVSPNPIQHIIDLIPAFLDTVKADRLHAEKHQGVDKQQQQEKGDTTEEVDKKEGDEEKTEAKVV